MAFSTDAYAGDEYLDFLDSHLGDSRVTEDQLYHAALLLHETHARLDLAERILQMVGEGRAISG